MNSIIFSKNVRMRPFVGTGYFDGEWMGRLLILGESHYHDTSDVRSDFTETLMMDIASGKWKKRYWTSLSRLVTGKPTREIDRSKFWNSVAFYNYVQFIVGAKSRVRPDAGMWENSKAPMLEVLHTLKPDRILVCGIELGKHLPDIPSPIKTLIITHPSAPNFGKIDSSIALVQRFLQS